MTRYGPGQKTSFWCWALSLLISSHLTSAYYLLDLTSNCKQANGLVMEC